MAAQLVQKSYEENTAQPFTLALTGVQAGSLIVVSIRYRDLYGTIGTVTGSLNDAYSVAISGTGMTPAIYYFENSAAGDETVTITFTNATNQTTYAEISEWSGMRTVGALGDTAVLNRVQAPPTGPPYYYTMGAVDPTGPGVLIGCLATLSSTTFTLNVNGTTGYTRLGNETNRCVSIYKINTGTGQEVGSVEGAASGEFAAVHAHFLAADVSRWSGITEAHRAILGR